MGILDSLKNVLAERAPEPIVLPDALVFNALDANALARNLDLEKRAAADAELNYPGEDSALLSPAEEEVVSTVLSTVRPYIQNYDSQQVAYKNRLASLDPLGVASKFRGQASLQINQLKIRIDQESGGLYLLRESLKIIEEDWQAFKKKWNISSDPGPIRSKKLGWLMLAAVVAAETILNGLLIGPYTELGLVGGIGIALMFPLITLVACGIWTGNLVRMLVSPTKTKRQKYFYAGFSGVLTLAALIINLWLAYTREAAETLSEWTDGLGLLFRTLSGDPQPFGAVSLLLFLVSSALYVFAVLDVYKMKHPIPGLIEKFLARQEKHREFSKRLQESHSDLIRLQQESTGLFKTAFDTLNAWQVEYNQIQESKIKLWQQMQNYLDHIESSVNTLFKKYREINRASRSTNPPRYFNEKWIFPELNYRASIFNESGESYASKLQVATVQLEEIQKEVNEVFSSVPELITGIDSLIVSLKQS